MTIAGYLGNTSHSSMVRNTGGSRKKIAIEINPLIEKLITAHIDYIIG